MNNVIIIPAKGNSKGIKKKTNKKLLKSEKTLHKILIRKFVITKKVKKNQKITKNYINSKLIYSNKGILPKFYYKILGKKFSKDLEQGHILKFKDIK